jgi:hypothetical protein
MIRVAIIGAAVVAAGVALSAAPRASRENVQTVPLAAAETFTVSGLVRDEVSGRPMPNVMIFADSQNYARTTTDSTGRYRLPALALGYHVIVATKLGYYIERREIGVACEVAVTDAKGRAQPTRPCDLSPRTLNFGMREHVMR